MLVALTFSDVVDKSGGKLDRRELTPEEEMMVLEQFRNNPNTTMLKIFSNDVKQSLSEYVHHPAKLAVFMNN